MKVYRISHRADPAMGFYRTMAYIWGSFCLPCSAFMDREKHPCPRTSGVDPRLSKWWSENPTREQYFFGFRSMSDMRRWVESATDSTAIQMLCEHKDIVIREYDSNDCFEFDHQCVFRLDKAYLKKTYHFNTVFGS